VRGKCAPGCHAVCAWVVFIAGAVRGSMCVGYVMLVLLNVVLCGTVTCTGRCDESTFPNSFQAPAACVAICSIGAYTVERAGMCMGFYAVFGVYFSC
jgi:TctA family transporter